MLTPARLAVAAIIGVLLVGGAFMFAGGRPSANTPVATPAPPTALPSLSASASASPSASSRTDYSDLPGRILVEHFGNAPDGSESGKSGNDKHRFYLMDTADMQVATLHELLPGQPATGKISAEVSPDGKRVVFQDYADKGRIWEANLDGTSLHELRTDCDCIEGDPAYDPTGTRIVFAHIEGSQSWLAIRDLSSGKITRLDLTIGSSADAIAEQPSWSPDGQRIVFHRLTWGGNPKPASGRLSIVDVSSGAVTDLSVPGILLPGEPDWSPDGSTIVFTSGPLGTTAGVVGLNHSVYSVKPDGSGLTRLTDSGGAASWTPDGRHILFYDNYFWLMDPDGSARLPVDKNGMDLSDQSVGFGYIGHWIPSP